MSSSKSLFLNLSEKFSALRKFYLYYNIYIRNIKFFFNNSQFGEDKKIIKLFKNYNRIGTYLDIGCFHPTKQNNTYLMYKLGWRGINIDLNPLSIELFKIARPKDLNICAAVSDKKKIKNLFYHHALSSLNTLDKNHRIFLKKHFGINDIIKKKIKTKTLDEILRKYKIKKIDFLNVDIEGHELEALKTLNFNYFDIKVICIEIINYNDFSMKIKNKKKKIFNFLKSKNYRLKFRSVINYIFVKIK